MPMGRRPTVNSNLPPRMRARHRPGVTYYYYDAGGKPRREIPLGTDYAAAVRKWAELEADKPEVAHALIHVKHVWERYMREVLPGKAKRTQADNLKEAEWLLKFFNNPPAPLDAVKPIHIRQYLDWRTDKGQHSLTRANREKALFSHWWNKAREWGLTSLPNPCAGVKGFTEPGRDIYIEDQVFEAVYAVACQPLRDAMDAAYLGGQRPADTLRMSEQHIKDETMGVTQGKRGKKLRIAIEGEFKARLDAMIERKAGAKVHSLALVCNESGRALTAGALRSRFEKARRLAAKLNPAIAADIMKFWFMDLRAKAGTDKAELEGLEAAQQQLGHKSIKMTEHYVRARKGQFVKPTK